jgi:hypothetical protein
MKSLFGVLWQWFWAANAAILVTPHPSTATPILADHSGASYLLSISFTCSYACRVSKRRQRIHNLGCVACVAFGKGFIMLLGVIKIVAPHAPLILHRGFDALGRGARHAGSGDDPCFALHKTVRGRQYCTVNSTYDNIKIAFGCKTPRLASRCITAQL